MAQPRRSTKYWVSGITILLVLGAMAGAWYALPKKEAPLSIDESIRLASRYLINATRDDGSLVYEYDPIHNTMTDDYNILRHSGATYALIEAYEYQGDPRALAAGKRAIGYLLTTLKPCPLNPEYLCVVEDGEIKLGGNALAVLALTEYAKATNDYSYMPQAKRLAEYIVSVETPEGEFTVHKMQEDGMLTPFTSEYYPGEAIFALARLSKVSKEGKWMERAHQGAHWLIEVRDANRLTEDLPHDHWLLYGLNELYADRPDSAYVAHAKRITDSIVAAQHTGLEGEQALWNGGYYNPPRSTPTATRSEGLLAAYSIFKRAGENAYMEKSIQAAKAGIDFSLRTQMTPGKAKRIKAHPDSIGGFSESLSEYTIRNDYVQHNLSALIAYGRLTSTK